MAQKPVVLQCKSPCPQHVRMVAANKVVHASAQDYGEATEVGLCSCVTKADMPMLVSDMYTPFTATHTY